MMVLTGRNM